MITPCHVERLVSDGSFQLVGSKYMPTDFRTFTCELKQGLNGLIQDGPTSLDEVEALHPGFEETVCTILDLAGYSVDGEIELQKTVRVPARMETSWHQDFADDARFPGFTILYSKSVGSGANELHTAGRDRFKHPDQILKYSYRRGPVVIAQSDFALPDTDSDVSLGRTWHTRCREVPAVFVGIDILNPKRPYGSTTL